MSSPRRGKEPAAVVANTSVDQALRVLTLFVDSDRPLGVSETARRLDIPPSTAHRLLATMAAVGYLERADETGGLRLGINARELGAAVLSRFPIVRAATPVLRVLLHESGQTTSLHVRIADKVVRIAGRESPSAVSAALRLGETRECPDTPMGRMLLAHLNPEEWPRSPRVRRLAAELADLRSAGHSLTVDQTSMRTQTLVWPVLGVDGSAVAVLALEGPQFQFDASVANIRRLIELSVPLAEHVRSNPQLATNPFAHVPDRDIKLRVGG